MKEYKGKLVYGILLVKAPASKLDKDFGLNCADPGDPPPEGSREGVWEAEEG